MTVSPPAVRANDPYDPVPLPHTCSPFPVCVLDQPLVVLSDARPARGHGGGKLLPYSIPVSPAHSALLHNGKVFLVIEEFSNPNTRTYGGPGNLATRIPANFISPMVRSPLNLQWARVSCRMAVAARRRRRLATRPH